MQVHSLAIPSAQTVNGEGMTEVVRPRSDATAFRFQSGQLKQNTESVRGGLDRKSASVHANKEPCILVRCRIRHAGSKIDRVLETAIDERESTELVP